MRIEYDIDERDLNAFFDYTLSKNETIKKTNIFNYVLICVISYWQLIYLILFRDFLNNFNWTQLIFSLTIGTITFAIVLAFSKTITYLTTRHARNAQMKKHKLGDGVIGEHLLEVNENGILERTDVNESRWAWKGVDRLEETPEYIYIYVTPASALIIPKLSFGDPRKASLVFAEMNRLKEESKATFSPSYLT